MNNYLKVTRGRAKNGGRYLRIYISDFEEIAFTTREGKKVLILLIFNDLVEPRDVRLAIPERAQKPQEPEQEYDDDFPL